MRVLRGLLLAVVLLSEVLGAAQTHTVRAALPTTPSDDTVTCRGVGYSILVPYGWHILGTQCRTHVLLSSYDGFGTITLNIDQPKTKPTMAAMRADLRRRITSLGTFDVAPDYSDRTISGVTYASAVVELDTDNGLTLALRMAETYHMHKHLTLIGLSLDQPDNPNAEQEKLDVRHVVASLHFL